MVSSNTELRQTVKVDVVLGYSKLHSGTLNFYLWSTFALVAWLVCMAWSALCRIILHQNAAKTSFLGSINNFCEGRNMS